MSRHNFPFLVLVGHRLAKHGRLLTIKDVVSSAKAEGFSLKWWHKVFCFRGCSRDIIHASLQCETKSPHLLGMFLVCHGGIIADHAGQLEV